eukprot:196849-Chlamydomonas_euryale.AAC.1
MQGQMPAIAEHKAPPFRRPHALFMKHCKAGGPPLPGTKSAPSSNCSLELPCNSGCSLALPCNL